MKSSIYISSEKVEVVGFAKSGRNVRVRAYLSAPLPEGVVIGGKITDPHALTDCLRSLKRQKPALFSAASLAVDGSTIFTKRILTPRLSRKQFLRLVKDEFAESSAEELVCDYHALGSVGGKNAILAVAAETGQIESYVSVCREAGIKLRAIYIGVQAILDYVAHSAALRSETFVVNVVDGVTMLSMIFDKGVNVFMSRVRLFGEGYEETIQTILSNLSGLIQFNKSEKFDDITQSYYLGLKDDDLNFMEGVNPYPDIELSSLELPRGIRGADKLPQDSGFLLLQTLLGGESIDLIRGRKQLARQKTWKKRRKLLWIPAILALLGALSFPARTLIEAFLAQRDEIVSMESFLTSEETIQKAEELDRLSAETQSYGLLGEQEARKAAWEAVQPELTNELLDFVLSADAEVTVTSLAYDAASGVLTVRGYSVTSEGLARYSETLKQDSRVGDVPYSGYREANEEGLYDMLFNIVLAPREVAS